MGLTFYPIEDDATLGRFRERLCPFMEAIQRTTKNESMRRNERESICDEIIDTARSNQINNQLSREWYQFIRHPLNQTLDSEHNNLIATNLE